MANNEKEIWKKHPEYAGIEVSTLGRVRTLDRVVSSGKGIRLVKGQVLKPSDNGKGYLQVKILIDGKQTNKRVNRLVAETFLPNPDNLSEVNHKSCVRNDNRVENLEWCTASYNRQYREKYGISQTESLGHPVFAINLSMLKVSRFSSQGEASRSLGIDNGNINKVIKGRLKQTSGYWFTNADENADDVINRKLHTLQSQALGL